MTGKRTRKPNLESTISQTPNSRGYYEAYVWMGTKADGKPDRRHRQRKSLPELRREVRQLEKERDAGRVTKPGKPPTVQQMMERHLDVVLPSRHRAPKTIMSYRSLCKTQIFPRWGAQRADRLLPDQIEDGLAEMLAAGLGPATVRKVAAVLSSAYEVQVARGNLGRNPCEHIEAPEAPESSLEGLTQAEAHRVLLAAVDRPNAARWTVGLGCGLRQGEALGLRWQFINLDTGLMTVAWQLQRLTWQHGCTRNHPDVLAAADKDRAAVRARVEHDCARPHCKTKPCRKKCQHTRKCPPLCPVTCRGHAMVCPERALPPDCVAVSGALVLRAIKEKRRKVIPLDPAFVMVLRAHRDAQLLVKLTADREWEDNDLVFTQWNGRPVDPRRDWGEWGDLLETAGVPHKAQHSTRHSAATFMLELGIAIRVVQAILGHADIRMTERYTHVNQTLMLDASTKIGAALNLPQEPAGGAAR